jgi:regulator of RNase E activity RraA
MHGFQVHPRAPAAPSEIIDGFRKIPVAVVSDVMSRMSAGGAKLRPLHDGTPLAGCALTVKTRPGDNLMIHKALDLAAPGDVIVVDAGGDLTNSLIGEIMVAYAISRGVAGFVMDGAIRDAASIRAGSFPVYAAGVTHRGPYRDGPGEINIPVALDGMVVAPGDIVLGDEDGVLCVPAAAAATILREASDKLALEERWKAEIIAGNHDRTWVEESLRVRGCTF